MEKFIGNYKTLYLLFRRARTSREIIRIMYLLNGGNLNPMAVFDTSDGEIMPVRDLRMRLDSMFRMIVKTSASDQTMGMFLNLNQEVVLKQTSPNANMRRLTAAKRMKMLDSGNITPSAYFDSTGAVR